MFSIFLRTFAPLERGCCCLSSVVEHFLGKEEVVSSSLIDSSRVPSRWGGIRRSGPRPQPLPPSVPLPPPLSLRSPSGSRPALRGKSTGRPSSDPSRPAKNRPSRKTARKIWIFADFRYICIRKKSTDDELAAFRFLFLLLFLLRQEKKRNGMPVIHLEE